MPFLEAFNAVLVTYAVTEVQFGSRQRGLYGVLGCVGVNLFLALLPALHVALVVSWYLKVPLIVLGFGGACYWDVRSTRPEVTPAALFHHMCVATLATAPWVPVLAVAVATCLVVFISVLEALGIDAHFLNWVVYYGVLYGPFTSVYYVTKRRCLEQSVLPG